MGSSEDPSLVNNVDELGLVYQGLNVIATTANLLTTLTIQRIPHPQKGHHQISTAALPANTQSNFIIVP